MVVRRLRYLDPRRSFAAKLVVGLLATVGLLLAVMLLVVRSETAGQVVLVAERTVQRASDVFADSEARRREQLAQRARVFTDTPRGVALLEAAIDARDTDYLTAQVGYELQLMQFDSNSLTVLADGYGEPILTLLGENRLDGTDPADVEPLIRRLLDSVDPEIFAYRLVEGRLYTVRVVLLELGARVVGATAFGLPIGDEDAEALGRLVDAEVCFVAGGQCVAGTARARSELASILAPLEGTRARVMTGWGGERWELLAQPLTADADEGWLVMAVPLETVLAPFDRIRRALALASVAALLLAGVLTVALSRGLTRPVHALVHATRRVARGEYETRVVDDARDEIGQLARSFNTMTEGLALKEQYRGVLDKVVSREVADELLRGDVRLGGENRDVTILFADVRGFTGLTEGMEPQEVIGLLNETMERLSAAVDDAGGVVDKYIGDEIMAVFGAPVTQSDHAARAVDAALAMQRSMLEMTTERASRGAPAIGIGIGIHSGAAVAGNMGAPNRLNYTVVGEAVNLASRLCSIAAPGEIMISETTRERLGPDTEARLVGERELKGFSRPVAVYSVSGVSTTGFPTGRSGGRSGSAVGLVLVVLGLAAGPVATPAGAQELPTLSGLGIGYISPGGAVQFDLSGRLDLEAYVPADEPAWIIPDTDPFAAARARLFGDLFLGHHLFVGTELRVDRGEEPRAGPWSARMDQAFVRVGPFARVVVQAGKFVTPFGGYPQRHHTVADPFVRPPLMYEYRTMVTSGEAPGSAAGWLAWKDGQPRDFRPDGAPPIWGVPYQWGGMVSAAIGPGLLRVAGMNSAPSSEPAAWGWDVDRFSNPSWVVGLGADLSPALRVDGWYNRGPYLEPTVEGVLDPGWRPEDYVQEIFGVGGTYAIGRTILRAEAFADRWEVPNVPDDAWDVSYYLEGELRVRAGAYVAARFGEIRFNRLGRGFGSGSPYEGGDDLRWDYDTRRLQLAAGYRLARNAGIRAEYMINRTDRPQGDPSDNLFSIQLWWDY
jgi:adenylate cyclase